MATSRKTLLNTMMKHRARVDKTTMREMFAADTGRFKRFTASAGDILLDKNHGCSRFPYAGEAPVDLPHDLWRKAQRNLVAQQKFGVAEQRAPYGDHLLLAARNL